MNKTKEIKIDQLSIKIYGSRTKMGSAAAKDVAGRIRQLLKEKEEINMIFAAAPSQNEFLNMLSKEPGIDWQRIHAFHMDEYIGLEENHPQRFSNFLKDKIFDKVNFNKVYLLNTNGQNPEMTCESYAELLRRFPPDIVCMGIGENTHVAFNDPHVADFNDADLIKLVSLDEISRQQQVHDGCFATLEEVPKTAVTLTVPMLMSAKYVYCIVPGINKAEAVYHTLNEEIGERYPSTSLRRHPHAMLYLDEEIGSKVRYKIN